MYKIGVDLGGTNIATGVVDDNYRIIGKSVAKTHFESSATEIVNSIASSIYTAIDAAKVKLSDIEEIGVGIPGAVDSVCGIVKYSCNLDFHETPVARLLSEKIGRTVYIENDANAAAFGEYVAGVGKNAKIFVAITLGTGVGSGILINGSIFSGSNCAGAELGHVCIELNGEMCKCGNYGCWEAYASATALIRQTKYAMKRYPTSKMWELCQNQLENVTGKTAFDAMRLGDEAGEIVVNTYCGYVAVGVSNIINIFQPDVVCIGGGVANEGNTLLEPVIRIARGNDHARNLEKKTAVRIAALGNDAGIIGAAYIREHRLMQENQLNKRL